MEIMTADTKPHSRGDEPLSADGVGKTNVKTPLTRG